MKIHLLKTVAPHFQDLKSGVKTFELRKNDRDYKVDDKLICAEYDQINDKYSGDAVTFRVQHILIGGQYGLDKDSVIMSLEPGHEIKI